MKSPWPIVTRSRMGNNWPIIDLSNLKMSTDWDGLPHWHESAPSEILVRNPRRLSCLKSVTIWNQWLFRNPRRHSSSRHHNSKLFQVSASLDPEHSPFRNVAVLLDETRINWGCIRPAEPAVVQCRSPAQHVCTLCPLIWSSELTGSWVARVLADQPRAWLLCPPLGRALRRGAPATARQSAEPRAPAASACKEQPAAPAFKEQLAAPARKEQPQNEGPWCCRTLELLSYPGHQRTLVAPENYPENSCCESSTREPVLRERWPEFESAIPVLRRRRRPLAGQPGGSQARNRDRPPGSTRILFKARFRARDD